MRILKNYRDTFPRVNAPAVYSESLSIAKRVEPVPLLRSAGAALPCQKTIPSALRASPRPTPPNSIDRKSRCHQRQSSQRSKIPLRTRTPQQGG